ncbi:MAG: tetratricopeptide repeat protein [Alphaproteobacteria bacterium]
MCHRLPSYVAVLFGFLFCFALIGSVHAQENEPLLIEDVDAEGTIPNLGELNTVDVEVEVDSVGGMSSISAPSVMAENIDEDLFFDAADIVPQGEMARQGPVPVNPSTQPASKFVTVTKNKSANSVDAKYVAAERAMALGRYDSALTILDALYEKNSGNARVVMGRATTLQKLGRFDEAMQMYEKLADIEPRNIDVQVNMLGLLSTRYPSVALRRLMELHNNNKSHVGVTAQLAVAYAQAGDTQSALSYLGAAAGMEPRNANHLFNMAVIADRAGYKDDAVKYYEKALEVDTIHGAGRSIPRDSVYQRLAQIR